MSKKIIVVILITMIVILGGVSLYTTFAYDAEAAKLDASSADYDLIYSLKELSSNKIYVSAKETKFIDITLDNTYTSTVRYAMYYNLLNHKKLPDNVTISLAEDSPSRLEDTIKSGENKVISIKIVNNSDDNLELVVGSVVGFENGNVADLLKENEVLIK